MKLVIVESPAKAKTIEKFLGPDYTVAASYGHIRDLPGSAAQVPSRIRKKPWARLAVDVEGDFEPVYIVPPENRKYVDALKKLMRGADELLLATDEDREGESISWHLQEVLEPDVPVSRITFHEITRSAIREALERPRAVDERLVRAQETRRILDRLYGYELSPVLWKKVRTKLSAGRVQSVALRLIVEREEERQRFLVSSYWDVLAQLRAPDGSEFDATLVEVAGSRVASGRDFDATTGVRDPKSDARVLNQEDAERISASAREATPWTVRSVERKETIQRPSPPFTTSTLQQAASGRLRMSPKETMRVAQRLYEGIDLGGGEREGLITYMRTDSVTLSQKALDDAAKLIRSEFGDRYHDGPRRYRTKARGAQEAHEAIRPSEISRTPAEVDRFLRPEERGLYRLIWERAVASQMADAIVDRTTVEFAVETADEPCVFRATGSILRFDGFLRVAGRSSEDSVLPPLEEGDTIPAVGGSDEGAPAALVSTEPRGHETRPPPRFTEASLVKRLEEEGIGRPSTYTPIISTIQDREYVLKKGSQLVPTYVGMAVTHLLRDHFSRYVDIEFTARMEETLDDIAEGRVDGTEFLTQFYRGNGDNDGLVNRIEHEMEKIEYPAIGIGRDPETGREIQVRIGRNHIFVQRGEGDSAADRATVPVDLMIDELTPERALQLFRQRERGEEPLGEDEATGEPIYLKAGPYGPYVQLGEGEGDEKPKRVSLPKGTDPEDVDLAFARKLISLPRTLGTDPESGAEVKAGLGRYGPYVQRERTYRNLPDFDAIFSVDLTTAVRLLNEKKKGREPLRELGEHPKSGAPLRIFDGRYGPYVTDGDVNASLPKDRSPEELTIEEAVALIAERAAKGKSKGGKGKGRRKPGGGGGSGKGRKGKGR